MKGNILFLIPLFALMITVSANFRILAPEFICSPDDDSPVEKPDNTVITIQVPAGSNLHFTWAVRWKHLDVITQRFTLMLWKAIRELEKKLNSLQPEPFVYVIEHKELLRGVEYIFNVTSTTEDQVTLTKVFQIDNSQGDQKLENIDGRGDMFSIVILGGQETFTDLVYSLEAQLTVCSHTQNYYFIWTVTSIPNNDVIDVSDISGNRLEIPAFTLQPNTSYDVNCQLVRKSTSELAAQTGLHFQTLIRGLKVYLSIDVLIISANLPFTLESIVLNHDYYDKDVSFEWSCEYKGDSCDNLENENNSTLYINGLPEIGEYKVSLNVRVKDQSATAAATIISLEPILPVIQIKPLPRLLNVGSSVTLVANVSNVAPSCTMTWYFAPDDVITYLAACSYDKLDDCTHGTPIADSVTIFSLEENFLNELTDFSNETEWRQIMAETQAQAGRARIVAECGCSKAFECTTKGVVYGDLRFEINQGPKVHRVKVTPNTGVALETVFRISTLASESPEGPLRYTFYCSINTDVDVELGSLLEHLAVETTLPYIEGGTAVWLKVCNSLGSCSETETVKLHITPGEARNIEAVVEDVQAHAERCEFQRIKQVIVSAVITYTNAKQPEALSKITAGIHNAYPSLERCKNGENFRSDLVDTLAQIGFV